MAAPIIEGFSLSHCAVLDGETGAEVADIYGVREATIEVDTDSYDNNGDDAILSSWQWFNFATLSVTSGYLPMEVAALLANTTITEGGTTPNLTHSMPLWSQNSLNTPTRPVLVRIPSKDSTGAVRTMDVVLFKVQFAPLTLEGPSYKDGLVTSYSGKAVMSSVDEKGVALVEPSIGRIVSHVGNYTGPTTP